MAVPTTPEARIYGAGAALGSAWGTEVEIGAGDEIKLIKSPDLPMALSQDYTMLKESNNTFLKRGIAGAIGACDITFESYGRYDLGSLGVILACLFGTAGTPSTVETGVYLHKFQWAASILGKFVSYAEEYPGKIYSVPSAKPLKVVLSLENGVLKITPTLRGSNVIDNSAVNPDLDDISMVNEEDEIRFDQMDEVWMDVYDAGDALEAADQKVISGLEITLPRGLETPKQTSGATGLAEAQEEDFADLRVKLDFPYDDSWNREFFSHFKDGTCYSLILRFRGALLGATAYYEFTLFFPKLRLAKVPDLTKSGLVKVTAEFQAIEPAAAPTGFAHTLPYMTIQNARSSDYLA